MSGRSAGLLDWDEDDEPVKKRAGAPRPSTSKTSPPQRPASSAAAKPGDDVPRRRQLSGAGACTKPRGKDNGGPSMSESRLFAAPQLSHDDEEREQGSGRWILQSTGFDRQAAGSYTTTGSGQASARSSHAATTPPTGPAWYTQRWSHLLKLKALQDRVKRSSAALQSLVKLLLPLYSGTSESGSYPTPSEFKSGSQSLLESLQKLQQRIQADVERVSFIDPTSGSASVIGARVGVVGREKQGKSTFHQLMDHSARDHETAAGGQGPLHWYNDLSVQHQRSWCQATGGGLPGRGVFHDQGRVL